MLVVFHKDLKTTCIVSNERQDSRLANIILNLLNISKGRLQILMGADFEKPQTFQSIFMRLDALNSTKHLEFYNVLCSYENELGGWHVCLVSARWWVRFPPAANFIINKVCSRNGWLSRTLPSFALRFGDDKTSAVTVYSSIHKTSVLP